MTERIIRIIVDSSDAVSGARDIEQALKKTERQANETKKDVDKLGRGRTLNGIQTQAGELKNRFSLLRASAAGFVSVLVAGGIVKAADEFRGLQGQIALVTDSEAELASVTQDLFDISQRTRQELSATASLFIRLARATDFPNERIAALTETIGQTIALSRATPQAAQAALFQLGQGFAAGALRGEELNSVLEQTPELAKAIADGLDVTTGELRLLGQEGTLSAELVAQALEASADKVASEFNSVPLTVGDAVTKVGNSLTLFIGNVDSATGATSALASVINGAAEAIQGLAIIVGDDKGFGAAAGKVGQQIEETERRIQELQNTVNTGFETTGPGQFSFRIIPEGEKQAVIDALTAAQAELNRLKQLQLELIQNGGLTNAEKEARDVERLKNEIADAADKIDGLFKVSTEADKFGDAIEGAEAKIAKLGEAVEKGIITQAEADRLAGILRGSISGAAQREADAFVTTFESARQKAEAQLSQLNDFVADGLIDDDVAARIRQRLEDAVKIPPDPILEARDRFVDAMKTAAERTQDKIDELDSYVEKNLIPEETAQAIRDRLEKILAKELVIPVKADVQAVEDTQQRIDDLQGKIQAFSEGGAEGLRAFESFIEARDIIAELGDEATVSVEELTKLIATEKELGVVFDDTTGKLENQGDIMEDFFRRARENSQDILAGFLADPLSEGLDELPLKFAKTLQALAAQALASEIFNLLFGAQDGSTAGIVTSLIGAFGGGRASGGFVAGNTPYLVGEKGPELFVSPQGGNIIPNGAMGGTPEVNVGGPTIINTIEDRSIIEAFNRGGGGETVLNYVTENASSFRNALGI